MYETELIVNVWDCMRRNITIRGMYEGNYKRNVHGDY